ncbi:uncharacterized protein DEA37_0004427 [Paragonimus westermani]|uniref:Reverse transcriptase RNase H-like domain-containing protein n=1 Tax=Paragonimus westermani TaxID=34504 RepID=A0A5J4NB01_9TREM|nr:uncharacterized protein DEA37_0004427 [Paragonimus westermani]
MFGRLLRPKLNAAHKPLTYALSAEPDRHSPCELGQLDYISQYTSDLRYVKGEQNAVADAISGVQLESIPFDSSVDFVQMTKLQASDPDTDKHKALINAQQGMLLLSDFLRGHRDLSFQKKCRKLFSMSSTVCHIQESKHPENLFPNDAFGSV